ncbi:Ankyrin-like protein [Hapsidospora chrysogenum ATCC 11550]|uniref:Ankyrin-like protein n=1 Tax=Hapsidospora chrysogenum (strain ATCC 11550 / CBS 779.69 / DSM 880 / IAM 14645 / JCM 23072 / IMI 49137) TaxID=857340 RepID=A0A086TGH6_HAPC1|nr:Ankyrin-like protein [Hapsidospora chrysogenum ATCC 11550]
MSRIGDVLAYVELDDIEDEYCSTQASIYEARSTITSLLLEHPKVDVNAQDVFSISPLHIAARGGDFSNSWVRKLIENGAKISARTENGETPLHLASRNGNLDAVTTFLTLGADPMEGDINGLNALHYAAQSGHLGMLRSVVNHMPDTSLEAFLKSKDNHGGNVLHHLLSNGKVDTTVDITVVDYLLKWSPGINDLDNEGMSPMARYLSAFVLCSGDDDPEVVRLMFEYGANPAFETDEEFL